MLPATPIDDTVATLGQFTLITEVTEGYLVVLDESSRLIRNVGVDSALLLLKQGLFQLPLQILRVSSGLLHLFKFLLVIG